MQPTFTTTVSVGRALSNCLADRVSACIDEVSSWIWSNRLQVNPSKTGVVCCSSCRRQHHIPTSPVRIGSTYVLRVTSVRDIGLYIDCHVSLQTHVTATVKSCFAALRQIRSVWRCLPRHALLSLIRALVVSKVDYGCSLLAGVSHQLLYSLQFILYAAARLVFSIRRSKRITPLFPELHWLRIPERITLRLCVLTHRCLDGSAPAYLAENIRFDSRREKTPSSTVVYNNNTCRSAGAEIYHRRSCFSRRCAACMEQSTIISSNCYLSRFIQTPADDISICPYF